MKRAKRGQVKVTFARLLSVLLALVVIFGTHVTGIAAEAIDGSGNDASVTVEAPSVPEENAEVQPEETETAAPVPEETGEAALPEETTEGEEPEEKPAEEQVEEEPAAEEYPAQTFEGKAAGVLVRVDAPKDALPAGTDIDVLPVTDPEVLAAIEDAVEGEVETLFAVDISFWKNRKVIEPRIPVNVTLTHEEIAAANEAVLVHVNDDKDAKVVDQIDNPAEDTVEFESDEFSTYAVVSIAADATNPNPWTAVGSAGTGGSGSQGSIMVGKSFESDNEWQIVSGEYESNTHNDKPAGNDKVKVQKNVIPTDTENEFLVYMSIDALTEEIQTSTAITEMLELNVDQLYTAGTANGFPSSYSGQEHTGNGSLADGVKGSEKSAEPGDTKFTLLIYYNNKLIAHPVLSLAVPNSVLYLRVPVGIDEYDFICLENIQVNGGRISIGGRVQSLNADGTYHVPVYLTTMSYNALLNQVITTNSETTSVVIVGDGEDPVTITDPMGPYIIYQGLYDGNSDVSNPASAATTPGTTVTWTLDPKDDPLTSPHVRQDPVVTTTYTYERDDGTTYTTTEPVAGIEPIQTKEETVIRTTWWSYNIVEIVYKVKLDVTKTGFNSGDECPVNGPTVLDYQTGNVTFPVPKVTGTLYDFSFDKVDGEGNELEGAMFSLTAGNKTYTPTVEGNTFTFTDLPWGTYTLKETTTPPGYTGADDLTLNIGYTEWPDFITHKASDNDIYAYEDDWQIVNEENKITVTKVVKFPDDIDADKIDHTIYVALWDRNNNTYYKVNGNIVYQTIVITNGVPNPATFTFDKVPAGSWSVWELSAAPGSTDASATDLEVHTVIYESTVEGEPSVELSAIATSGTAELNATNNEASVTVTNTYAYHSGTRTATVRKAWAKYDGTAIAAADLPEGITATFTLYHQVGENGTPEVVTSVVVGEGEQQTTKTISPIILDGVADENGESAAWTATWTDLPLLNEEGHVYIYKVRETDCSDAAFIPYIGTQPMGENDYQTNVSGGTITNRKQTTDVDVQKIVVGHSDPDQAFGFTASYGDTVLPVFTLKNGETYTIKDVPVGVDLSVTEAAVDNFTTTVACGTDTAEGTAYTYTVAEPADTIIFTNTRQVGDLSIRKTVESTLTADRNAYYEFTITLDDETVNGSFKTTLNTAPGSDITFTNGVAKIELKHGDVVNIIGLPAGVDYTVAETPVDFFDTESEGAEGTISSTAASTAAFTNTRRTGELSISKTVVSNIEADKEIEFAFRIMIGALNGTYQAKVGENTLDVTFTAGIATVRVKDGETIVISGLPEGLSYGVSENPPTYFTASFDDEGSTSASGTISSTAPVAVECTNTRNVADLDVKKVVKGLMGDRNKKFSITISSDKAFMDGENPVTTKTVELAHGESITLKDVPVNAMITVTETGADDYTKVFVFKAEGEDAVTADTDPAEFEVTGPGTITVTNTKNTTPDTGISLDTLPYLLILVAVAVIAVLVIVRRRRHHYDE